MRDIDAILRGLANGEGYITAWHRAELIAHLKRLQAGIAACQRYEVGEQVTVRDILAALTKGGE
ncbi:MAG: hypothetical protein AAB864_02660 [Patescibacteria group bacterium]